MLAAFAINLAVRRSKIDLMNASHLRIFLLMVPVTAIVVSGGTLMNLWFQGLIPDAGLWNLVLMEVTASATGILLVTPAALLLMAKFIHRILERLTEEQKTEDRTPRGSLEECHFPFSVQRGHLLCFRFHGFGSFRFVLPFVRATHCSGAEIRQSRGGGYACDAGLSYYRREPV